jgi:threonine aldolase
LLPAWEDLTAQVQWARERGAAAHLDGARLWESQPYYNRPHAEIAGLFDTVYVSLYKGLEGVRGAVLAGDDDIIAHAEVWRHRLGGALPDVWPLAVAALIGLDEVLPRMSAFRDHAVAVAAAVAARGVVTVVPKVPQTPLFHILVPVDVAALTRARDELIAEQGVQVFSYARAESVPGWCGFEVMVGEHAMDFEPEEVAELIDELVRRALR